MTISFYLKRPNAADDTAIYAYLFYENYRLKYYTPEKIHPKFWNKDSQKARETQKFPEYAEFNQRLKNWKSDVGNLYRKWVNDNGGTIPSPETLKELLDVQLKKIEPKKPALHSFFPFFDDFVKRSLEGSRLDLKTKKATVYNTTKGYISTLNHLKNFQKTYARKIDFKTIDLEFYNDYIQYLTHTVKLSSNTIGDHIKRIKTILNEATEKEINKNMTFRSRYFAKPSEQTQSIYLNRSELKEMEVLDLSANKRLDAVRDLFLIGCYTGLRYSDYSILKPEQIIDGFIETTQTKTGTPVVIPIHPTVKKILDKYNGQLPKAPSNQKTNDYLKEVGKLIACLQIITSKTFTKGGVKVIEQYQKWELLTTHTARRSFASNEYRAGTPAITIMAITGHKTEKDFLKYIKLTPKEHAEILKLQWQKRHALQAV